MDDRLAEILGLLADKATLKNQLAQARYDISEISRLRNEVTELRAEGERLRAELQSHRGRR